MADTMRIGFKAVSDLVKSWKTGEYVHHVRHITDKGSFGHEFLVIFSVPHATKPVPEHVANATFTVKVFEADDDKPPKITYTMETQKQKRDGSLPIRKMWLDAAVARKRKVLGDSKMFSNEAKLPPPVPFIPGQYRAEAAVVNSAMDGLDDNQERMLEAMADLGEAQDVAARNEMESVAELEELLVHVFKDADADGNGVLDPKEFSALLDTADLGLDETEKHQLMMLCDVNGDGRIEYAEFAPIGADVIQTMRMRKLNQDEGAVLDAQAELEARKTLHSLGAEEVTSALLRAFKNFDEDGSGRLERAEIEKALQSLTLGPTKLTKKEVRMIMLYIDEDDSGTIEYAHLSTHVSPHLADLPFSQPLPAALTHRHPHPTPPCLSQVQRVRAADVQLDGRGAQARIHPERGRRAHHVRCRPLLLVRRHKQRDPRLRHP